MHDDPKPSKAVPQTQSSAWVLQRVADTLGVPVASFGALDKHAKPSICLADPEEAAVLAVVQSYLRRAHPASRERFLASLQSMIKLPFA